MPSPPSPATFTSSFIVLTLLLATLTPTDSHATRRDLLAYTGRKRSVPVADPAADSICREMGTKENCQGRSSRCKWCRSDALDDMCFGFSEAWRLPHQVFSCE